MKDSKKILITGAAGFIGFHLSKRLILEGYEVIGLDSINNYYDTKLKRARLKILNETKGSYDFIKHDKTLPSIKNTNIKCPKSCKDSEIIYILNNSNNMKYTYMCKTCDSQWTN